jgi:type II secretory pathway predicted ATPase ExeA
MAGENRQIFTEAALHRIYKETRGILRLTNRLCTECLLDAVSRKQNLVDDDSP